MPPRASLCPSVHDDANACAHHGEDFFTQLFGIDLRNSRFQIVERGRLHREHVTIAEGENIDEADQILAPTDMRVPMLSHRREIATAAQIRE
jgi:hypothetical protein